LFVCLKNLSQGTTKFGGDTKNCEDRKAIITENLEPTQDFRSLQSEKLVSGLLSVQSMCPLRSNLRLHLSFATPS